MKTTDLMIGDWIQYYDCNLEKQCYAQVTSIQADGVEQYIQTSDSDVYYSVEEYKPILLTEEILVWNRFEHDPHKDSHFYWDDEYKEVDIHEISDSIWLIEAEDLEFSMPTQRAIVCNVHELQHALKLCGIDKEIEL